MRRRFNYTNRQRINRSDLAFTIVEEEDGTPRFYAGIDLKNYVFPSDASVWVEAYDRNALMRFPFGSVAEPKSEKSTMLTDFIGTDSYYFRVKVVDKFHKSRLIGVADSVSPVRRDEDETAKSLLRVTTRDLDSIPWKLEYQVADHPLLVINSRIDTGTYLARSNHFFQALVLPAILEQILYRILLEDKYFPAAEPDDDDMWKEGWLEFAGHLPGNSLLPVDKDIPPEDCEKWIVNACDGFCREINAINKIKSELKELDG